jgi:excisionase family DNA binding protein
LAEEWLTMDEAAAYLKVSKPSLYRFCAEGRLPFFKLAGTGSRRFRRADLDALLEPGHPGEPVAEKRTPA